MTTVLRSWIVETSTRIARVALAEGERLLDEIALAESRRHARDLTAATRQLLRTQGWKPSDLHAVLVSRGPGSFTGLRVGIISAKILAYALKVPLIAIDTFAAIARQAPPEIQELDILEDGQQGHVYWQRWKRDMAQIWHPASDLTIVSLAEWQQRTAASPCPISGPGATVYADRLPSDRLVLDELYRAARPLACLQLWREGHRAAQTVDPMVLEPTYFRASYAEEQAARLHAEVASHQ